MNSNIGTLQISCGRESVLLSSTYPTNEDKKAGFIPLLTSDAFPKRRDSWLRPFWSSQKAQSDPIEKNQTLNEIKQQYTRTKTRIWCTEKWDRDPNCLTESEADWFRSDRECLYNESVNYGEEALFFFFPSTNNEC